MKTVCQSRFVYPVCYNPTSRSDFMAVTETVTKYSKAKMQTQTFQCVGMSKPRSFTLYVNHDHCWATSGLAQDRFDALFKWAKSDDTFWEQKVQAMCEFDGYSEDGSPINAKVILIKIRV